MNETRDFQMHPELLYSVIMKQAGSLWKAVIEGIMNSADAGSTECRITLTQQMLRIEDDGRGFRSRDEIKQFFEVFGQPHTEQEQKQYGKFRMGRGQLFAFGHNTWRTGTFQMLVDVKRQGLKYDLQGNLAPKRGCVITVMLYDPLSNVQFAGIIDDLRLNAKYAPIPTYLNDAWINKPPASPTWDYELDVADIKLQSNSTLRVYNQGILVCSMPYSRLGTGGDIVTKVPIGVNFARNDVMSDCPVWAQIKKVLSDHVAERNTGTGTSTRARRTYLTDDDRNRMALQMLDGDLSHKQVMSAKVFMKCYTEGNNSLREIRKFADGVVSMSPDANWRYDAKATKIQNHKLAYVFSRRTLGRFQVDSCAKLVDLINARFARTNSERLRFVRYEDLCDGLDTQTRILEDSELTDQELITLEVLRNNQAMLLKPCGGWNFHQKRIVFRPPAPRRILVGLGERPAWTDGKSYIAISRRFMGATRMHPTAWAEYARLLMHEYMHTTRTDTRHKHSNVFFKNHHDWAMGWQCGYFAYNCTVSLGSHAAKLHKKLTKAAMRKHDAVARSAAVADKEDARAATT